MLKLSLLPGEYIRIGEDTIVQLYGMKGERAYLAIGAPRDVSILRGTLLEEQGQPRPADLVAVPPNKAARTARASLLKL